MKMKKNERQNNREIRKQAHWAEVAGLMVSRPMKIARGTEEINGLRKPK